MLSVATSIDALAVGISLAMLGVAIWIPALVTGAVAASCTGIGLYIGEKAGASTHVSSYADALGGLVLIGIGINILHQHGALAALV